MTSSGAFMVNFEQISQMILVLPWVTIIKTLILIREFELFQ